jgi:chorismate mutase/prephenate dehydratase
VLGVFKSNKINLTWIESFPLRDVKGEYVFFADFDGHHEDPKVKKAIKSLEDVCESVAVLGSFPAAKPAE